MTKLIKILAWSVIVLGLCIHLRVGLQQPLFGDEISSLFFANSYTYTELLSKPIEVIHPNTYYVLIKLFMDGGVSVTGLRVIQWVIFCLTLIPVYGIMRRLKLSPSLALWGLVAWTWSAYLLRYSYMLRMYGLGILLVAVSILLCQKKKWILQIVIDIIGVNLVMGYWFFIAIKYTALCIQHKKQALIALALFTLLFVPTLLSTRNAQQQIAHTYLYWVPIPKSLDALPMLTTLLGLTSTAYFEGYAATPSSLPSVLILIICLLGIAILYLKKSKPDFLSYLAISSTALYLALFSAGLVFQIPLFHIRQLFPVAIILTLFTTRAALSLIQRRQFLVILCIIPIALFGIRKTISYAIGPEPMYPRHYQDKPASPIYFTTADIELGYTYCGATSFSDLTSKCPAHDLHLLTPNTILPNTATLTSSALKATNDTSISCSSISVDFHTCNTIDNSK